MIQQYAIHPARTLAILAMCACLFVAAVGYSVVSWQVVRDPENPAFVGNAIGSAETTHSATLRDPENPYWTGATTTDTARGGKQTQGLR